MKLIDEILTGELCLRARGEPRLRTHHLLHDSHDEAVQRMLIAIQPGSYIRPHRHSNPPKWELILVLQGAVAWLGFDALGRVSSRTEAGDGRETQGLETPPGTWHSLVCLQPDSILFECKQGPFNATLPEDFAPWAPPEGAPDAADYVRWMARAQPGERLRLSRDDDLACS